VTWQLAWLIWIAVLVVTFAVIETLAIVTRNGEKRVDTFTSFVQSLTEVRWRRDVAAGVLVGSAAWAVFHFWL
jgi:hypothetical protein